jgi:predicted exporter
VRERVGQDLKASVDLYLEHRASLLSVRDQQALADGRAEQLYRGALLALYTPAGFMRPIDLSRDPLGLGADYLLDQIPMLGNARLRGAQLVVTNEDKTYVLVIAETVGSPFAEDVQDQAEVALRTAVQAANAAGKNQVTLLQSGALQHATLATRRAQSEVALFGTIGTIAVLTLMLALFRDWRAPALGLVAISAGAAAGICATYFAFGEVHVVALVFGSSLIGVAIDYSMHFYADQFRAPATWVPTDALAHVGRPILISIGATVLGYIGLLALPFPGLKQMALISIAGLAVACACVFLIFPAAARGTGRNLPLWCATFMEGLEHLGDRLAHRKTRVVLAVGVLAFLAIGLSRIEFRDDIRTLQMVTPRLAQMERRVGELLGSLGESRYFVVSGTDAESLLQTEERLSSALRTLRQQGTIDAFTAVSNSLPSLARQAEIRSLVDQKITSVDGLLPRLMQEMGFDAAATARQVAAFQGATAPLLPEEWLASPVSAAYRDLWLGSVGGHYATVVTLAGIRDVAALRALAGPEVRFVDRVGEISSVLARYRIAVSELLLLAYAAIFLALAWRYGLRDAAWLLAAPLGATVLTLAFAGAFGLQVNLFAVLGLLMLLALGVDYAIFLRESSVERLTAVLSVTLSAITTMIAFGLLAFSSTPLIRSIGLTLFVGIGCCWLIAVGGDAWRRAAGAGAS